MKNLRTLFIYMVSLLLSAVTISADAQERQDALYIFRNDGQFNAFFYGDITRICYSKTDTLGVEQEDYVVQEVWALDSVYRIPISAIDSVAFLVPEKKIRSDVFYPDESIVDYIIDGDSVRWIRLASNTPQELIPQKDQKLLIEKEGTYIPDGFGGRVILSELDADGWLIVTEAVALTDIYEQLLVKGAVTGGQAESRSRGPLDGTELTYVEDNPWTLPKLESTVSVTYSMDLVNTPQFESSYDLTGSLGVSAAPTIKSIRAFMFIDPQYGMKFDIKTNFAVEGEIKAAFGGSLNARLTAGLHKDPFKKKVNGLKFEVGYGLFLEGSMSGFELSWTKPLDSDITTYITGDHNDLVDMSNPVSGSGPLFRYHYEVSPQPGKFEFTLPKQVSIGMGLFAKAEASFGIPLDKFKNLPDFILKRLKNYADDDKKLSFGLTIGADVGGKLDFNLPLTLLDQLSAMKTMAQMAGLFGDILSSQPVYKKLDEESDVVLSGYSKIGAELKLGKWKFGWAPNASVSSSSHGLVPRITGISVGYDEDDKPLKPWRIKMLSPISRNLLAPVSVGFFVTDQDGKEVTKYDKHPWFSEEGSKGYYSRVFTDIDPGKGEPVTYKAYPLVNFHGVEMLPDCEKEFTLDAARIDLETREIFATSAYGDSEENAIGIIPNMSNMQAKAEAKWLLGPYWNSDQNKLEIGWEELPDTVNTRRGVYRLYGLSSNGKDTLTVDSVVVTQYKPYIELNPKSLEFDTKGGTQIVTIGKTNITGLTVSTSDKFMNAKLDGDTIKVTVNENPKTEDRDGYIYVEGKDPSGKDYKTFISVSQKGLGAPPEGDLFNIYHLSLSSAFNLICTNADAYKEKPYKDWEPTKKAYPSYICYNGEKDYSLSLTMIDEDNLHLKCTSHHVLTDYNLVATTDVVFSADITKIREEDEDGDVTMHLKISNAKHVGDYVEQRDGITRYTKHYEYTISPGAIFYTIAYPAIYDEDGNLDYRGKLMWMGGASYWGQNPSLMYYEEYTLGADERKQRYEYIIGSDEESGTTLQIEFEPNSLWDSWLEGETVDDFGYNTRK